MDSEEIREEQRMERVDRENATIDNLRAITASIDRLTAQMERVEALGIDGLAYWLTRNAKNEDRPTEMETARQCIRTAICKEKEGG